MERITQEQAKQYISLKEDYTGKGLENAVYFTITPSAKGDGWEDVTYYTSRKKNIYSNKGEGTQWVYVLSNPTSPGILKIGYTSLTPDERAKQISNATGVALPYKVEWAFKCFDGEQLEGEVHNKLSEYRINNQREFFQIELDEAKKIIKLLGKNYI